MKKRNLCVWNIIFCGVLCCAATQAVAQINPLCETALWNQMTQRAFLHGQMDTEKAQTLMYKPDSVLEYTCFDRFMNWAMASGNMPYYMSEGRSVYPWYIAAGTTNYINANFSHNYLGGRANVDPPLPPVPASSDYVCDVMPRVWDLARCLQLIDEDPEDDMVSLIDFTTMADPRTLPAACTTGRPPAADFGTVPATAPVITAGIGPPPAVVDCGIPIPTGKVITEAVRPVVEPAGRPVTYNEKVCPHPGCSYVPTALDTGNCVEIP